MHAITDYQILVRAHDTLDNVGDINPKATKSGMELPGGHGLECIERVKY